MQSVNPDLQWEHKHSRTLAMLDKESLRKLQTLNILIMGLKGTGVEVAKNLILMGVAQVTLNDPSPVEWKDLSANFYLKPEHVGKNTAESCLTSLKELNMSSTVVVDNSPVNSELIKAHKVVVFTEPYSKEEAIRINKLCRDNSTPERTICNIIAGNFGVYGLAFVDFGSNFLVLDPTGEDARSGGIRDITCGKEAMVTLVEGELHGLSWDDHVKITQCTGDFAFLNDKTFPATGCAPNQFILTGCDTSKFAPFSGSASWEQIKTPQRHDFNSLESFYGQRLPFGKFLVLDDFYDRPALAWLATQALQEFFASNGSFPKPYNEAQASQVLELVKKINAQAGDETFSEDEVDSKYLLQLINPAFGSLCPISSLIGGLVANQCITAISAKWTPLNQWLFFDAVSVLPEGLTEESVNLTGTRYDGQIAVLGNDLHEKIRNLNYFLVGAGAIGCELLKNFSMMGLSTGSSGKLHITDMDTIEISNLSRQFLFREQHVGKLKAQIATEAALAMNSEMKINTMTTKVAPDTESVLNNPFWYSIHGVAGALDNFEARAYIDRRCLFFQKPFVDSATTATQCTTKVVQPKLTSSWVSGSAIPTEETFLLCTVHALPTKIDHTIHYARYIAFQELFVDDINNINKWISDSNFLQSLLGAQRKVVAKSLGRSFLKQKTFEDCIEWAFRYFEQEFNHKPHEMLHRYPADYLLPDGAPFWTGMHAPSPLTFNPNDPLHLSFIVSATQLRAYTQGIVESELKSADSQEWAAKVQYIKDYVSKLETQPWVLPNARTESSDASQTGEGLQQQLGEASTNSFITDEEVEEILSSLPKPEEVKVKLIPVDFEKDDDRNFHVDFVHNMSSLRATVYSIGLIDRLRTKIIVGKIIPAIITATAFVAGLSCLEIVKQQQPSKTLNDLSSTSCNLALPYIQRTPPEEPVKKVAAKMQFTEWTRLDIPGPGRKVTTKAVVDHLGKFGVVVETISVKNTLLWLGEESKLGATIVELHEAVKGAGSTKGQHHLELEIGAKDRKRQSLTELPFISIWLAKPPTVEKEAK